MSKLKRGTDQPEQQIFTPTGEMPSPEYQQAAQDYQKQAGAQLTVFEKSKKLFKTMSYVIGAWTVLGVVVQLITGQWGSIFDGIIHMIGTWIFLSICCFTIYPFVLSSFHKSAKAGEQFWRQKF